MAYMYPDETTLACKPDLQWLVPQTASSYDLFKCMMPYSCVLAILFIPLFVVAYMLIYARACDAQVFRIKDPAFAGIAPKECAPPVKPTH